jgi:hypothetical protein
MSAPSPDHDVPGFLAGVSDAALIVAIGPRADAIGRVKARLALGDYDGPSGHAILRAARDRELIWLRAIEAELARREGGAEA